MKHFIVKLVLTAVISLGIAAQASVSYAADCAGVRTTFNYGCSGRGDGITQIFLVAVNFLAIGVGIAVVGGIVFGALRYISSNGNSSQAQQGITYITNAIIGLVLFLLMYAVINFLVPGGLFSN